MLLLRLPEDALELSCVCDHDEFGSGVPEMLYAGLVTRSYTISWMCRRLLLVRRGRKDCQSWDVGCWSVCLANNTVAKPHLVVPRSF